MDIFEYLKNERRTFSEKGFSVLDGIVLSKLVYLKFDGIIPKEGIVLKDTFKAEYYFDILDVFGHKEKFEKLYTLMVLSPRFRDIKLKYFVNDSDEKAVKQFAAITYILGDKIFIAFRGTDISIIGWKENFQMTYTYPIESQKEAKKYVEEVFKKEKKKMLIGGHSKGGNLSIYSAINVDKKIQKEILKIYSLDGPGFPDEVFESKEYKNIQKKIIKVIPRDSLIGIMFEKDKYLVCKSLEKGALQHEPFFWQVKDGDLVYFKTVSRASTNFNNVMKKWFDSATPEEREAFVEIMFSIVKNDHVPNLYSKFAILQETPKFIQGYNRLEPEKKELVSSIFKNLANIIVGRDDKDNIKKIKNDFK